MNRKNLDAKRIKMLKAAFVKLREAANLINKVNIRSAFKYDCPVLGVMLCDTYGKTQMEVQVDDVERLQQLAGSFKLEKHSADYVSAVHESGTLKLFALIKNPAVADDDDE